MNQRPSRRCINQLNEQIEELKSKDIVVVGIQASKVDDNILSEWVQNSGVSFSTGMIPEDIDEVKFKWGVKGLPWLVLTDKKHTVIAEGFSLSELGGKIMSQ
jgi:hypothetical protein